LYAAYKWYAEILRIKLKEEVGKKHNPGRKQDLEKAGRRWITYSCNIFVLNHLIQKNKQTEDRERKVYALFADLKAAFNRVDRGVLLELLRRYGIKELIRRLESIYIYIYPDIYIYIYIQMYKLKSAICS